MNKPTLIHAIEHILKTKLPTQGINNFNEQARLNEDLYLDSVLLLQLLVNLELEHNIPVPDEALNADDFATVSSLANFLLRQYQGNNKLSELSPQEERNSEATANEEFEDIKVHCFVSCLCEIIKADDRVDHRPFYFGVWDAEVIIDDNYHINYHSQSVNHDFFRHWYEKLYGVSTHPWYRHDLSKADNINILLELLENKTHSQRIMVMLDMFRLPERENKFNQNPFPHYVMLEKTEDPDQWFMSDPDFRWEGLQEKSQVIHGIESPSVAGGYYFSSEQIRPTPPESIYYYFLNCIECHQNPMTNCLRQLINIYTNPKTLAKLKLQQNGIDNALKQVPVLAIRKYAYEHGLAFFWREMGLDDDEFEYWCDIIEALVSGYKKIQYRAIKIANMPEGDPRLTALLSDIHHLLDEQDAREFKIKHRLVEVFNQWCQQQGFKPITIKPTAIPQVMEAS